MKESTATAIGFLIAPIFPALMGGVTTLATPNGPDLQTVLAFFPIGYLVSGLVTVVLGVPMFLVLRRLKMIRWWSAVIGGFAIGTFVSVILQWPLFRGWPSATANILIYGA